MKKIVLLSAALSCVAGVSAQSVDTLKEQTLQDVQVVATRADARTPVAYKNLSQKEIKKVNFGQDVPYLISLTPSVTVTSDAGNAIGYTSLRVRGTDPSRINITVNGVPQSDAESSQVYWVNMGDFASSLGSMQIQRGVGTSTNGAGAFGATLNMQTENVGVKPFMGIDLSAGTYYSHKETLRFGTGLLGGHWGLQGRLSNIGSKGYLDRASTKLNSYFLQGGYFAEKTVVKFVTWNGTEQTYHAWNYASKYEQSKYGRRYNSCGYMYKDADGNIHYYKDQNDNYHQQNYQLIWNQIFTPELNLNVTLHYTKGQGYYDEYKSEQDLAKYALVPVSEKGKYYSDLTRQKKMDNDLYGAVFSANYNNHNGLLATLGGGWNKYDGDHFGLVKWVKDPTYISFSYNNPNFEPQTEYYHNNALKSDFNIYGRVEWEFVKGLNGYADLQYRHVGYRMQDPEDDAYADTSKKYIIHDDFDFFNPKFGLSYSFLNHHKFYVSYAISHREPTRNDYQDNEVRHLKAERLNDLEAGYKYQSEKFSAGANFYWMDYSHQYVLTGELNDIGEMIASNENSGKSYRLGVELEAAWKPVDWFRWDINGTFSKNRAKDWNVTLDDGSTVNLGETHLTFSPDIIANNIFTFNYKGFAASIQSQFVGKQYLAPTDFQGYYSYDDKGNKQYVDMMLHSHLTTNLDLAYNFSIKSWGIKAATIGITFYNLFSKKYDNNGWAAPGYRKDANGNVEAYTKDDLYEAGFAPSAPFNCMAHLSVNF